MDTYLTAIFQTTRVRQTPRGGNLVDQSILDHFYAYLMQQSYKFKPGSNYGCAVKPTAAETRADEQKRQSGCSNCGKIVETDWLARMSCSAEAFSPAALVCCASACVAAAFGRAPLSRAVILHFPLTTRGAVPASNARRFDILSSAAEAAHSSLSLTRGILL
jgi:hypothetical protein